MGVRHHSPALAAAVPALLTAARPDLVLVELPQELETWLPWLVRPDTTAPIALAAAAEPGSRAAGAEEGAWRGTAFYPFADFSPELAALRWAARNGVRYGTCDLPLAARGAGRGPTLPAPERAASGPGLLDALRDRLTGRPDEDPWDRLVEASAPGSTPEQLRRAALLVGWALRRDAERRGGVDPHDLAREDWMRARISTARAQGQRVAAVVGSFHAPALTTAFTPAGAPREPERSGRPAQPKDDAASAAQAEGGRRFVTPAGAPREPEQSSRPEQPKDDATPGAQADGDRRFVTPAGAPMQSEWSGQPARINDDAAPADGDRRFAAPAGAPRESAQSGQPEQPKDDAAPAAPAEGGRRFVTSLIPYTYPLLDERSGYPAGIRDPEWQHCVLEAGGDPVVLEAALIRTAVAVCAELRADGHSSGPADAREIVRLAGDLARLRGLPCPGRGEFVEAVQSVLAQGEPLGRGRAVAAALGRVLVGSRTGRIDPDAPRSGLAPAVEAEAGRLGLPGPAQTAAAPDLIRLDPLRSAKDRQRELLLQRLSTCGVPYAEPVASVRAGGAEALGTRWRVAWTPSVAAMLPVAGLWGVTPAQAAEGALRAEHRRQDARGGPTPTEALAGLQAAAACGLPELTRERLGDCADLVPATGTLADLLSALALVDRLQHGHFPDPADGAGWPQAAELSALTQLLTDAALRTLDGLAGSEDAADARTLVELADRADALGGTRFTRALSVLAATGTPLMRAAADAVRVLLGQEQASRLGDRIASWVDQAETPEARARLQQALTGLLTATGVLLDSAPDVLAPLLERIAGLPDQAFVTRLPALRGGFDTLSPAARERLLALVEDRVGAQVARLDGTPAWTAADLPARDVLAGLGLLPDGPEPAVGASSAGAGVAQPPVPAATGLPVGVPHVGAPQATTSGNSLSLSTRWRLLLGRPLPRDGSSANGGRLARALDELYGRGTGEGSGPGIETPSAGAPAGRGGREAPFPGVRDWAEELRALFGPGVREEVLAAAVARGRGDALQELDPAAARPSVELLRTVLAHAGGLPEARIARLRPLVARLVSELSAQLATRLRPALTGLAGVRPTRRPGGPLDLHRTIRANLATARPGPEGRMVVVPERPVFHSRSRRSSDWRLILVVDVSGSMEASTVWAALTAAIMAGVPTVSTHFLAFSTEVVDFTEQITDPLSLLLEVRVGGGTHIAAGLRAARDLVTVPSRTLIAVISDFEEGYPVGGLLAETRHLVGMGCHLLGCASLDDTGVARYSTGVASQLVAAGMPVAALSPLELARWVGERIR
nr:DUF5682 family protein [Streptacidiphilus rugosus]